MTVDEIVDERWSVEKFVRYLEDSSDPRTENWSLVGSPLPLTIIIILYILVVLLGPKWMNNREAYSLRWPIIMYNISLTITSVYMFYEFVMTAYLSKYSLGCQPVDYSRSPLAMRMARVCWLFYFTKIIELADTVFFILRKKNNQLTFLHVYHHTTVMVDWYMGTKYVAGGQAFMIPLLNSFVHIWMYLYYGLAAIGPHMQKYLWWKRYLTRMQLTQFLLIIAHCTYSIVAQCDFPQGFNYAVVLYCASLVVLFANYYYKEYVVRARAKEQKNKDKVN